MTTPSELAAAMRTNVEGLSREEKRIVVATYRMLAAGEPVRDAVVASHSGVAAAEVDAFFARAPGIYRDNAGDIVGFWGLAIPEMPHRFHLEGGKPIHAWCAVDPFLVVPVIGGRARTESRDPITGEAITMTISPDGIEEVTPEQAMTSFLLPDGPFDHDVIASFCHYVFNFASEGSGKRWVAEHEGTMLLSVREAFEVGRLAWAPLSDPEREEPT